MYPVIAAAALLLGSTSGSAGTSFLTAAEVAPDRPAQVAAVTGDYLYWSFSATAGQQPTVSAAVTLPPAADRHGAQAWTIEVFDGLRRRQPCVAGEQSPVVTADATDVTLGCSLRQVRSWAEPSDGDPLPGTYFVRLSSTEMPEQDLGLPVKVNLSLVAPKGDTGGDQGTLAAPLNQINRPGSVVADAPAPEASAAPETDSSSSFLPDFSSRWIWTTGGGVLAAVAGLTGFSFTRRRVRRA
ncbi:peptidase [Actinoplanes sp. TBRC 11911]|uniref:peptidase n=1 Tax=Actinoplanes sp. TBRC 11911 TaxID=2729386 RepID=UPI00145EB2F9|nr:peptidase [Actinoplanes sp. TBRC 11911]NMO52403.1 peptidase [Actinoplanes sp. TBRC 11911]